MDSMMTFGHFLTEIRKSRDVFMKDLAEYLGISTAYLCDVEKDRKGAPKAEHLQKIAEYLELNDKEQTVMYDLAAQARTYQKGISPDLTEYIMDSPAVRKALRTADKYKIDDTVWLKFIEWMEDNYK